MSTAADLERLPHVVVIERAVTTGHGEISTTSVHRFETAAAAHHWAQAATSDRCVTRITVAAVYRTLDHKI